LIFLIYLVEVTQDCHSERSEESQGYGSE